MNMGILRVKKRKKRIFKSKKELEEAQRVAYFTSPEHRTPEEKRLVRKYLQWLREDPSIRKRLKGVKVE